MVKLLTAVLALFIPCIVWAGKPASKQVIAYIFVKDSILDPADVPAEKLTRINYAFANITGGRMVEGFARDAENFAVLNSLKGRNPALTLLVSVGGWTWSGQFSDMALTATSRATFIDSVVEFIRKYQLDGLDIDWEYPGLPGIGNPNRPEDKENYTALLKELRRRFHTEEQATRKKLFLSVATGGQTEFLAHTDMRDVSRYVDTVNLMSYDYYEPADDKVAGHHAALLTNPADPKHISADASVKAYLADGVPANKLVLGVPFYGHAWANVPAAHFGLYQSGGPANLPSDYRALLPLLQAGSGYERHWDDQSSVPFLYNPKTSTFVSYEDQQSLGLKCRYVLSQHLAGVMFWDLEGDSVDNALVTAIDNGLDVGK